MDQIIKTECIDFKALVSKNSNISLNVQTKMIKELDKTFTEEESRWHIANFYVYMNYHPTNDFPINLENVLKMMGFAHKKNAKRTLENNFVKDEDYKITLLPSEHGQFATEIIMLNIDTFKNLCMMIKTDKGKAIRKYYVKLENIYNKIIKQEIESQKSLLEETESQLATTQRELTKEKTLRNKMLNRRCFDVEDGNYIYIFQDNLNDPNSILKIGQTKNLILREQYYSNINKSGGIVFYKKCIDCSLIEKLCHHMLDKFRENKMQEWFNVGLDFAKQTVSAIIAFSDSKNIESLIPAMNTIINTTNNETKITNENTTAEMKINNTTNNTNPIIDKSNDFQGFLDTFCETDPNFFTAKEELTRAFRIYSKRTVEKNIKENLNIFLQNKFRSGVEFYENIRRNVWRGFRLRPLTFSVNNPDDIQDYEQFIFDKCQVNYLNRISYVDFFEAFVLYKKETDPNYILTNPIKQQIQTYLTDKFTNGRVHLSDHSKAKHLFGVLGLSLQNTSGLKQSKRTCKNVLQLNSETNECINTWESLTIAAKESGIPRSTLATLIKFQTIKNNCTFKYI
jgi:phage anti-repressor protein